MSGLTKEHKKICKRCKHAKAAHPNGKCHMKYCDCHHFVEK